MPRLLRHGVDCRERVVAVRGEMVDIEQEGDVACACTPGISDYGQRVFRCLERIRGDPAAGLDQDGAANPGQDLGRHHQVVDGRLLLDLWRKSGEGVAIENIEGGTTESLADGRKEEDIFTELSNTIGVRQNAAISGRHVAGKRVKPDEADVGVSNRANELVDVPGGRIGDVKWPPEFDGVESGRLCSGGTFEQRQVFQEDRAVDSKIQTMGVHPKLLTKVRARLWSSVAAQR